MHGLISVVSDLLDWSTHLFLWQYQAALIKTALKNELKSVIVMPLSLLLLFKVTFAIQSLLCFHMNFRVTF